MIRIAAITLASDSAITIERLRPPEFPSSIQKLPLSRNSKRCFACSPELLRISSTDLPENFGIEK